jgi:hypothetical protein
MQNPPTTSEAPMRVNGLMSDVMCDTKMSQRIANGIVSDIPSVANVGLVRNTDLAHR